MDTEMRMIDSLRLHLYSAPLAIYGIAKFLGMTLLVVAALAIFAQLGALKESPSAAELAFALVVPVGFAIGATLDERKTRRRFDDAADRLAYLRTIETGTLPERGAPNHWREEMLTALDRRWLGYFALIMAIALVVAFVVLPLNDHSLRWSSVVVVVLVLATSVFAQIGLLRTSKRVERLYHASNPDSQAQFVSRSSGER